MDTLLTLIREEAGCRVQRLVADNFDPWFLRLYFQLELSDGVVPFIRCIRRFLEKGPESVSLVEKAKLLKD